MALGITASMVMGKYVRSNVRNVSMFQCNLFTWTGIRGEHRTTSFERPKY